MLETQVWTLGGKDTLGEEMATHSSIVAWRIPWTEERGGLQTMGSQGVGHDWAHTLFIITYNIHSQRGASMAGLLVTATPTPRHEPQPLDTAVRSERLTSQVYWWSRYLGPVSVTTVVRSLCFICFSWILNGTNGIFFFLLVSFI